MSKKLRLNKWYVVEGSNSYTKVRRLRAYRLNIIAILIALGVFIAILSVFSSKADTQSVPVLRERCSSLYDGQGRIKNGCQQLIRQALKNGNKPWHEESKDGVNVTWH